MKKAEGFNEEQLAAVLDLDFQNHQDLQALACVCFTCFTGIRIEDLHQANTANVTRTAFSTKNPRNWKIQLLKTNNKLKTYIEVAHIYSFLENQKYIKSGLNI